MQHRNTKLSLLSVLLPLNIWIYISARHKTSLPKYESQCEEDSELEIRDAISWALVVSGQLCALSRLKYWTIQFWNNEILRNKNTEQFNLKENEYFAFGWFSRKTKMRKIFVPPVAVAVSFWPPSRCRKRQKVPLVEFTLYESVLGEGKYRNI